MEFQEFREELLKRVNRILPSGVSADYHLVQKNNGVFYTGILLNVQDENGISAVLYAEQLFECFLHGSAMEELAESVKENLLYRSAPTQLQHVYHYEKVRDFVVFRLIGSEKNLERMNHEPHRDILDMVLSYAVLFEQPDGTRGLMSVTNELLKDWGVTEEMLYQRALLNTPRLMGEELQLFSEYCGDEEDVSTERFRVLTNTHRFYGATAMLYSARMREYAEALESNLYIIPLSVHEIIVTPRKTEEREGIRTVLRLMHADVVKEEDILTDSIYVYDLASNRIRVEEVNGIERG